MDSQFVRGTGKTTASLILIAVMGLFSPIAMAQEEVSTTESSVQRLDEVTIPSGTIHQLEGVEPRTSNNLFFGVGGSLKDSSENELVYLDLDYEVKYYFFGLELEVHPHFEDWLTLNHGEGPRGHIAIPIIRF